jgi:hypothetical protein
MQRSLQLFFCAVIVSAFAGCEGGAEQIVVEREPEVRQVGEACVLDSECGTGRCIGGVCQDNLCQDGDGSCREDELCVFGECVPADEFACTGDQAPLIGVSPLSLTFEEVALGDTVEQTVTLTNMGDCLLTVQGVGLADTTDDGFGCEPCDVTQYPQRLAPQRSLDVIVRYSPPAPGEAYGQLLVRSDDATAGADGVVAVDLRGTYSGVPVLVIEPLELNFGYVPSGSSATDTVTIRNMGSGNAVLNVERLTVYSGGEFWIDDVDEIYPTEPVELAPYDPNNPATEIIVPVWFEPEGNANYDGELYVSAAYAGAGASENFTLALTGSSLGPPQIDVSEVNLEYKHDDGTAYSVGEVAFRQVTISNTGQSPLNVNMTLQDPSGDFSVSPTFVPPIAAGGAVILSVFFNPSAPSDPVNEHDPQIPVDAFLNITSNDDDPAEDVLKIVSLEGWAKGGVFDDILKIEMEYENADNGWAGNDYRDVDLELISAVGFSCGKPIRQYGPDGNGGFIVVSEEDPCEDWNNYQQLGSVNWLALGQYEEPERVLLYGLGQDLGDGDVFTARIHYIEDCANIPTSLLGDIIGIGASVLLGVLGGAVGIPISVPPDQISDLVSENCWDRESSMVTAHVFLNGEEIAAVSHRLRNKGDYFDIVKLQRLDGQFTLLQE